jgi:hypothetical protein
MIAKESYLGISLATRRNRRMLVVGYWLIVALAATVAPGWFRYIGNLATRSVPGLIFAICTGAGVGWLLTALGGMGGKGPVSNFEPPETSWTQLWRVARGWRGRKGPSELTALDERDIRLCNAAHYEAYKAVRLIALVVPILIILFGTILRRHLWLASSAILVLVLVVFNLPQSLILWWEPDIKETQQSS